MRRVILAICGTAAALALLLSFKTHSQSGIGVSPAAALGSPAPGAGDAASAGAASPSTAGSASATAAPAKAASPSGSAASGGAKTVTGAVWQTIYGPVQVQITVKNGKITAATALEYPEETPRDYQINSYAIPELNQEAVAASSAKIDAVSGATYTSGGYIGSLQSAVDKAGL